MWSTSPVIVSSASPRCGGLEAATSTTSMVVSVLTHAHRDVTSASGSTVLALSSQVAVPSASAAPPSRVPKTPNPAVPEPSGTAVSSPATTTAASTPAAAHPPVALCRHLSSKELDDVSRLHSQYLTYFDHIRFRKGWAEPAFQTEDVTELFREAADYTVRIRKLLDERTVEAKLRSLDGQAQLWLHAGKGVPSPLADPGRFVRELVHNTFQDARGYVEGLKRTDIEKLLDDLAEHRYNPSWHLAHLLTEVRRLGDAVVHASEAADGPAATAMFTRLAHAPCFVDRHPAGAQRQPPYSVPSGCEEDNMWREAIKHLYSACDVIAKFPAKHVASSSRANAAASEATGTGPPANAEANSKT